MTSSVRFTTPSSTQGRLANGNCGSSINEQQIAAPYAASPSLFHKGTSGMLTYREEQMRLATSSVISQINGLKYDGRLLKQKNQSLEQEMQWLKQKHEAKIKSLEQKHETQVKSLEQKHEAKIKSLEQKHETQVKSLEQKHETQVKSLEQKHETQVKSLEQKHEMEVKSLKRKIEEQQILIDNSSKKNKPNDSISLPVLDSSIAALNQKPHSFQRTEIDKLIEEIDTHCKAIKIKIIPNFDEEKIKKSPYIICERLGTIISNYLSLIKNFPEFTQNFYDSFYKFLDKYLEVNDTTKTKYLINVCKNENLEFRESFNGMMVRF